MSSFDDYITLSEASTIIGCTESNLRKHISKGNFKRDIDCKKFGATWIFKKEALKNAYNDFPLTFEERKEAYQRSMRIKFCDMEDELFFVEPEDLGEGSNLLAYVPADSSGYHCPMLVIDSHITIGFFRGYWIADIHNTLAGNKVYPPAGATLNNGKYIDSFKTMTELINYILIGSGCSERTFTEEEMKIVKRWFDDSMDIYLDWKDNCYDYTLPEMR